MPSERARVLALLDELQAAEHAGAEALGQWMTVCRDPRLRGGLRVIRARDAGHAALAESRLRSLGGAPTAQASRNLAALSGVLAAPDVTDRAKVALLLGRFPAGAYDPFADIIRHIEHDSETRTLLETIGDDERASLGWLREMGDAPAVEESGPPGRERERVVAFLDALRAAETVSAELFVAWVAVCPLAGLRGGLRTIAAREATNAALLAERLRDLGAMPRATIGEPTRAAALARVGARELPDEEKLAVVLAHHPEDADAGQPIMAAAESLGDQPETRETLCLIAAAEAATVAWLRAYHAAMVERHVPRARASGTD